MFYGIYQTCGRQICLNICFLTVLLCTELFSPCYAQTSKFETGFKFIAQRTAYLNKQINLSNYDPEQSYGRATGIEFRYYLNPKYFVEINGLNSFQGQKYSYSESERDTSGNLTSVFLYTRRFDFNYYKFPVNVGMVLNPAQNIKLEIALGPQISYLNTAYYVLDADTVIRKERSFKQTLKKADPGLVLSAGVRTQIIPHIILHCAVRTDISLLDADSKKFKPTIYATSKNFTAGISFGLSYTFYRKTQIEIEPK